MSVKSLTPITKQPTISLNLHQTAPFSTTPHFNPSHLPTPLATIPLTSLSTPQPRRSRKSTAAVISHAFKPSEPPQFARLLIIGTCLAVVGAGAKYFASGIQAAVMAYRNTSTNLQPLSDQDLLNAHDEIIQAAEGVVEQEQRDNDAKAKAAEEKEKRERQRAIQKKKEELGLDNNPNKPKFFQDDFSDHLDQAAIKRRELEEEKRQLDEERYISNEQEIELNAVVEKWEFAMAGTGEGFKELMDIIEAESILDVTQGSCIEELRDQRGLLLKLNHPDHGGSQFLTQKINEAFDLLSKGAPSNPEYTIAKEAQKQAEFERIKAVLMEQQREQLRKEGLLDEEGEIKHPDGSVSKKYDKKD